MSALGRTAVWITAVLLPLSASAAGRAAEKLKVAVMPVDLDPTAKNQVPLLINDIVLGEVQQLGMFEVIGQDDVNAMLGFEKQKEVFGCDDTSCIAQLGGALGVQRILAMRIARLQDDWVVTAKVIDIQGTRVEARANEFVPGSTKELLQGMGPIIRRLFGAPPLATAPARAPAPQAPPPASPPPQESAPSPEPAPAPAPAPSSDGTPKPDEEPAVVPQTFFLGMYLGGGFGTELEAPIGHTGADASFFFAVDADWWVIPYIGLGMVAEIQIRDKSWYAFAGQIDAGFDIVDNLRLLARADIGVAYGDLGEGVDPGLYFGFWAGAHYQFVPLLGLVAQFGWIREAVTIPAGELAASEFRAAVGLQFGF